MDSEEKAHSLSEWIAGCKTPEGAKKCLLSGPSDQDVINAFLDEQEKNEKEKDEYLAEDDEPAKLPLNHELYDEDLDVKDTRLRKGKALKKKSIRNNRNVKKNKIRQNGYNDKLFDNNENTNTGIVAPTKYVPYNSATGHFCKEQNCYCGYYASQCENCFDQFSKWYELNYDDMFDDYDDDFNPNYDYISDF